MRTLYLCKVSTVKVRTTKVKINKKYWKLMRIFDVRIKTDGKTDVQYPDTLELKKLREVNLNSTAIPARSWCGVVVSNILSMTQKTSGPSNCFSSVLVDCQTCKGAFHDYWYILPQSDMHACHVNMCIYIIQCIYNIVVYQTLHTNMFISAYCNTAWVLW